MANIEAAQSQQAYLEQIVLLVQKLYGPNAKSDIEQVQSELQAHQRGPCGWLIADALLGHPDQSVQFFGALTFLIKINQDAATLDKESLQTLRQKLLSWLLLKVNGGGSTLVIRKLCSSVITFCTQKLADWKFLIRHVSCCFNSNETISEDAIDRFPPTDLLVANSAPAQVSAILSLTTIMAEDGARIQNTSRYSSFHALIKQNLPDAVAVMKAVFAILSQTVEYQTGVLQCLQAWNFYAREVYEASSEEVSQLHTLYPALMDCLSRPEMFEATAEFFIDAFTGIDSFAFSKEDTEVIGSFLQSAWGYEKLSNLEDDDPEEAAIIFAQLLLAFGQATAGALMYSHETAGPAFDMIHRVTRAQTGERVDRGLANAICDFWENFTLSLPFEDSDDLKDQTAFAAAKHEWMKAIDELCFATQLVIDETGEFVVPRSDDALSEFRARMRTSIQATYNEFGVAVLQKLVHLALIVGQQLVEPSSHNNVRLRNGIFSHLETILFCLGDLSTSMQYSPGNKEQEKALLERLFTSPLFATLTDFSTHVPIRLRKRTISIIGDQHDFFKRNPAHLMAAIDMLFTCLSYPDLAEVAARSIFSLSDSGRKHFVNKVDAFCSALPNILRTPSLSEGTKENFVASVAFVLQAMRAGDTKTRRLDQLIDVVASSSSESLTILSQLKILGDSIQAPGDDIIDIDSDAAPGSVAVVSCDYPTINTKVVSTLSSIMALPGQDEGQILVGVCDVIRTGYREKSLGFFVFDADVTAGLVASAQLSNSRLDYAISTGAVFLSSRLGQSKESQEPKLRLISFVINVIDHFVSPSTDPEVSHACVDFIGRLVPLHLATLSAVPADYTLRMFNFALQCMNESGVPLAKKSAINLWTAMIGMSSNQAVVPDIIQSMGPGLAHGLALNFGGNAQRSEIEGLSGVLRKLVFKQPMAKQWIETALGAADFPSKRATDADKARFLAQVMQCRGDKKTENVARDFWVLCRGTPAGYS